VKLNSKSSVIFAILILVSVALACGGGQPEPTSVPPTDTPGPEPTTRPTSTPRPTPTLDVAATQYWEERLAEVQSYYDQGFISTTEGGFTEYDDFKQDWAQIGWYNWVTVDEQASDFFLTARFRWSTAAETSDISGCGFVFAVQENTDHYAVFLDKSRILFLRSDASQGKGAYEVGKTRGTGRVSFGNPAEADFTLIVKGAYAYVLVDGKVVGEYTLSKDSVMMGRIGVTVFSGTNKDYGTRCEMRNLHLWIPNQ
jgi:hypothetical protein